jgi:predicted Co/Zn/Cd cation transporter (cation efflux family)
MKRLDIKSSLLAGVAGAILLYLMVQLIDYIESNNPPWLASATVQQWLMVGFIVGFSVQSAERLTGAS